MQNSARLITATKIENDSENFDKNNVVGDIIGSLRKEFNVNGPFKLTYPPVYGWTPRMIDANTTTTISFIEKSKALLYTIDDNTRVNVQIRNEKKTLYRIYTFAGEGNIRFILFTSRQANLDNSPGFFEESIGNMFVNEGDSVSITKSSDEINVEVRKGTPGGAKRNSKRVSSAVSSRPKQWKLTAKVHTSKDGVKRKVYSDGKGTHAVKRKVGNRFVYKKI